MIKVCLKSGIVVKPDIRKNIRRYNIYTVNENFFDEITTQEQAYVLGWFYPNGNITANGRLRIQTKYLDILHKIKDIMEYSGPIYHNPSCLSINRKSLAEKIRNLSSDPHSFIPAALFSHFVRGVFDRCGRIEINKGKYCNVILTSQELFLNGLRGYLRENLSIDTRHHYRYTHTDTMSILITKTTQSLKFLDWIYKDNIVCMARKYDIYQKCRNLAYNTVETNISPGEHFGKN